MNREFIPYEFALKLKELGFDESCFGWYNYGTLCLFGEYNLTVIMFNDKVIDVY